MYQQGAEKTSEQQLTAAREYWKVSKATLQKSVWSSEELSDAEVHTSARGW